MELRSSVAICLSIIMFWQGTSGQEYRPAPPKYYRPGEEMKFHTTGTYKYDTMWYTVEDRPHFVFNVQSCGTAFLALTRTTAIDDGTLEIALGTENNTHSRLSFAKNPSPLYRTPTKDLLHCNEFRQFWIRWSNGWLEVGRGPLLGDQKFINYYDGTDWRDVIKAVGFASEMGYSGLWKVMENAGHFMLTRTPDSHRYDMVWKKLSDRYFMDFSILACGHGHVLLATEEGQTHENLYEFVIGGWDNNRTVIRTKVFGEYRAGVETPNILTCDRVREFWISWLDGVFKVGRGGMYGQNELVTWTDVAPTPIKYMSFTTGFGATGSWFWYEDREPVNYLTTEPTDSTDIDDIYGTYWIESPAKKSMFFAVTACTDARILLSEYDGGDSEFDIEVIIGGDNNTKISFGYVIGIGALAETYIRPVLDCVDTETFWLDWHNGTLRLGKGITPGTSTLLEKQVLPADGQFQFKAYSFATPKVKGLWRFRDSNGERVRIKTPNVYNHHKQVWRSVPHRDYFQFRVKACKDAHIALSPTPGVIEGETYLDLIFGGWENQRTVVTRLKGTDINQRDFLSNWEVTPDLMNCDMHIDLWISWKDDEILMGKGSLVGHHILASASMDQSYPIKYLGMSTGWGAEGDWFIEEDNGDYLTFYMPERAVIGVDNDIQWIRFNLRGCTDAVIYLSATGAVGAGGDFYEIGIGSEGNTKSYIKLQYDLKTEVETLDILDCENNYPFWLSWIDGKVEVGRGFLYGVTTFMSWQDPRPFEVLSVQLSSNDPDLWGRYQILENLGYLTRFFTPVEYQYHTAWRGVEHTQSTTIGLTACSDGHIILSSQLRNQDNMYEIVIGGWANTRSAVRTYYDEVHVSHYEDNVLSCNEKRMFWISWADDTIEVGKGEVVGKERFLEYHPLQMYDIRFAGFSTGYGYNGTWELKLWNGLIPVPPTVTPGPEETTPPPLGDSNPLNGGQIAGVVIGSIGAVVLIGLIITSMVMMRQGKDLPLLPPENSGAPNSGAMATTPPAAPSASTDTPADSNA